MRLKGEIIERMQTDRKIIWLLMTYFNYGEQTIRNYIRQNHIYLTVKDVLMILSDYLSMKEEELLENEVGFKPESPNPKKAYR